MTNNTNITKEIKRHIDVLVERFDEKVDLIAEQHGSIMQNIQSMKGYIKELRDGQKDITGGVEGIKGEMVEIKGDVKELKEGQENIKMVQMNHSEQFEIIKSGLRQKVDWKDFEVLEKRVLHLEAKVR